MTPGTYHAPTMTSRTPAADHAATRPATDRELDQIREALDNPPEAISILATLRWLVIWLLGLLLVFVLLGLVIWALSFNLPLLLNPLLGLVAGFLALVAIVFLYALASAIAAVWENRKARPEFETVRRPQLEEALADARVDAVTIRPAAVVALEAFEDEGDGYVFDLGDGRLLFLKGQDLYPSDETMPWPNTDFDLVRTHVHGFELGLTCRGEYLPPQRTIPLSHCKDEIIWDHEEAFIEGTTLDAFVDDLLDPARLDDDEEE